MRILKQRIDKFLALQLNKSRSEVKTFLKKCLVTVNGLTVKNADFTIETESDTVLFEGQAVEFKEKIYIVMNKPKGVLSATEDKTAKTVIDLIPKSMRRRGLFPVGRLDKDTTGLLIITDDGDFAHRVLSPKMEIYKTYTATLDGEITDEMSTAFLKGVTLADGTKCRKAFLKPVGEKTAEIKICEGRFHQIKRMFGTVGLGVEELHRNAVGGYFLPSNLGFGDCIEVEENGLNAIFGIKKSY